MRKINRENAKRKVVTTNTWVSEALSSLEGLTTPIHLDSMIALQLGADRDERETRLRYLTQHGWLHMSVKRDDNGGFIRYEWTVR